MTTTQSSRSGSKSLTPTELAETRKAALGLRLSVYATMVGMLAILVPIVFFVLAVLPVDTSWRFQFLRWGLLGAAWLTAGSTIANTVAAVLMLGAPPQMKVARVGLVYAVTTIIAAAMGLLSALGRLPPIPGWLQYVLIYSLYPAWFLYLRRTAQFTEDEESRKLLRGAVGLFCVGVTVWLAIVSQGLIQLGLQDWNTTLTEQLAGSTFLQLFGMERIENPIAWLAVPFSVGVLVALLFAARSTKGDWRYVLHSMATGWVFASIAVILSVFADHIEIGSPYYTLVPVLVPALILLGTLPLVLIPFRVFNASIAVLRSLENVCTASASGTPLESTDTKRWWFQRRPFLAAATSLSCIGGLVLVAYLFSNQSPDTPNRQLTGLDALRQQAGDSQSKSKSISKPLRRIKVGMPVPELRLAEFVHGQPMTEYEEGKIHVIDFWATWCKPCVDSIPHTNDLAQKYSDDVVVIGISNERRETVNSFLKQTRPQSEQTWADSISYRIAIDQAEGMNRTLFNAAGRTGIPCVFVVGRDGVIEWIGHPSRLEKVLRLVVMGVYDRNSQSDSPAADQAKLTSYLNRRLWETVASGNSASEYSLATFERMVEAYPQGVFYNTIGVAHFRTANYKAAIQACLKSVELTPAELNLPGPHASDLAFLAMSHFQLGHKDEAAEYRQQFVEAMKLDAFTEDEECLGFAKEVDALFETVVED